MNLKFVNYLKLGILLDLDNLKMDSDAFFNYFWGLFRNMPNRFNNIYYCD